MVTNPSAWEHSYDWWNFGPNWPDVLFKANYMFLEWVCDKKIKDITFFSEVSSLCSSVHFSSPEGTIDEI